MCQPIGVVMRRENVDEGLSGLAFEFFYWFSRFEYALKMNKYLVSEAVGAKAEPGWDRFAAKFGEDYEASAEAKALLHLNPMRQVVTESKGLTWKEVGLAHCRNDLERVTLLLRTARNNLFHGGKTSKANWDDLGRTRQLLEAGLAVLPQLADFGSIKADFDERH